MTKKRHVRFEQGGVTIARPTNSGKFFYFNIGRVTWDNFTKDHRYKLVYGLPIPSLVKVTYKGKTY